ncbi:MAG: hypothetical protein EPN79_11345 [Burkholderiaceae bacterium]|nr:MAG: hypothetical protein EPN79_11345 [Burkholderiaceae bacterium]TBR76721.1 MAG: hypothetical protein EPN64_05725 [Burkholderiaceae bacterium]
MLVLLTTALQTTHANAIRAFFGSLIIFALFGCVWVVRARSVVLFMNADGVWVQSGLFPWSRGAYGLKWRDIEIAYYDRGFIPWITRSYKVRVINRFSRVAEITLTQMARGNEAVLLINEKLQSMVRASSLQQP